MAANLKEDVMADEISGIGKITFWRADSTEAMPSGGEEHRMTVAEHALLQDAVFSRFPGVLPINPPGPVKDPVAPGPTSPPPGPGAGKPIKKGYPIILSMLKLPNGEYLAVVDALTEKP